jgi:hypothetical protein
LLKPLPRGLCLALLAVAPACRKEPAAPPAPNVVVIRTTDYAFTMPDTIPSGVTRLRMITARAATGLARVGGQPQRRRAR